MGLLRRESLDLHHIDHHAAAEATKAWPKALSADHCVRQLVKLVTRNFWRSRRVSRVPLDSLALAKSRGFLNRSVGFTLNLHNKIHHRLSLKRRAKCLHST